MTKEIPLTKGKVALVDDEDFEWLSQWKWNCSSRGYAVRNQHIGCVNGKQKQIKIYMHRLILGADNSTLVDHINHDFLDNRRVNIRLASHKENSRNRLPRATRSSRYKGLAKSKSGWRSYIMVEGKYKYLGVFKTEEEAAKAYNLASLQYFPTFSYLNEV